MRAAHLLGAAIAALTLTTPPLAARVAPRAPTSAPEWMRAHGIPVKNVKQHKRAAQPSPNAGLIAWALPDGIHWAKESEALRLDTGSLDHWVILAHEYVHTMAPWDVTTTPAQDAIEEGVAMAIAQDIAPTMIRDILVARAEKRGHETVEIDPYSNYWWLYDEQTRWVRAWSRSMCPPRDGRCAATARRSLLLSSPAARDRMTRHMPPVPHLEENGATETVTPALGARRDGPPPPEIADAIHAATIVYGWPEREALRVAWCESRWTARVTSRTDDLGLMQMHRGTWALTPFRRMDPMDPVVNALAAGWWWQRIGRRWGARGGWVRATLRCARVR